MNCRQGLIADMKLDIIDTQAHIGPGGIEETLSAMNALGIRGLLIDEYWLQNFFAYDPHEDLGNGVIRPICPTAEDAAARYPDRFAWVLRVNRLDPAFREQVDKVKNSAGGKAIRLIPGMDPREVQAFAAGGYDALLGAISESGMPLFLHLPDAPELIAERAGLFPELRIVVDHCGLFNNNMRAMNPLAKPLTRDEQLALYDRVLALGKPPNVYLKWAHFSTMFELPAFPGEGLQPILRKTIDAFGANRIVWASDFSVNQSGDTWGELLYSVLGDSDLSASERSAILGANARRLLSWE